LTRADCSSKESTFSDINVPTLPTTPGEARYAVAKDPQKLSPQEVHPLSPSSICPQSARYKDVALRKQSRFEVGVASESSVVFHGDDRAPLPPCIKSASLSLSWCLLRVGLTKRPISLVLSSTVGFQVPLTSTLAAQRIIF